VIGCNWQLRLMNNRVHVQHYANEAARAVWRSWRCLVQKNLFYFILFYCKWESGLSREGRLTFSHIQGVNVRKWRRNWPLGMLKYSAFAKRGSNSLGGSAPIHTSSSLSTVFASVPASRIEILWLIWWW